MILRRKDVKKIVKLKVRAEAIYSQIGMAGEVDQFSFVNATLLASVILIVWFVVKRLFSRGHFVHGFHEKYVLLTGCDSGFGKVTALELDRLGFNVFATCLTKEGQEELNAVCSERLKTIHLDVTDSQEIRDALGFVMQNLPANTGLWGLINNAGIARIGPVEWQSLEDYKRVADVNLWGLIDVTKVFLPLIKKECGRIINLASIAGRASLPHASSYSISKFGVEAFSDALRRELKSRGVKVSVIEPGFFKTNITNKENLQGMWKELWAKLDPNLKEEYGYGFYQTSVSNMLKGMVDTCASPHLCKVVDAIVHALASQNPKSRYVVGWDAKLLWIWISWLPAPVGDALLNMLGDKTELTKEPRKHRTRNGNNNIIETSFA
ncbi:PREDICTED: retinol dehydrogenase 3-like isoform X1 [Acropora digitifera]|uniref:retinol dehydrogenase 3-like isoform X1 n=2 Tax=Acropora digitifera TaxID=70779 RepID=UPI00077A595F|nr:PREDICTED: retinol dehydrogenase 3-like isoform X1 [Acropora digitifera]